MNPYIKKPIATVRVDELMPGDVVIDKFQGPAVVTCLMAFGESELLHVTMLGFSHGNQPLTVYRYYLKIYEKIDLCDINDFLPYQFLVDTLGLRIIDQIKKSLKIRK